MERSALAESRLSRCSVVRPQLPGDVSIRESYSRSQCRLRLLAIAALGQHHPRGVQLASARRAKCHTYQSTLLPPAPSRVVVDRRSWLAVSAVLLFLTLCCPVALDCIFSSAHIPPKTPYTILRTRTRPPDTRALHCQHWDTALLCYTYIPKSLHVPPAWDCACKPLDPFQIPREQPTSSITAPRHNHNQSRPR